MLRLKNPEPKERTSKTGFLLIASGGTAGQATKTFQERYQLDGAPFPRRIIQLDTDHRDFSSAADACLHVGLTGADVEAMLADPTRFGPACETIVQHHPQFLKASSIKNGARTFRMITQLALERHMTRLIETLHKAIRDLVRQSGGITDHPHPVQFLRRRHRQRSDHRAVIAGGRRRFSERDHRGHEPASA